MDRVFSLLAIGSLCIFLSFPSNAVPPPGEDEEPPPAAMSKGGVSRASPSRERLEVIRGAWWDEKRKTLTLNGITIIEPHSLEQIQSHVPEAQHLIIEGGLSDLLTKFIRTFKDLPLHQITVKGCFNKTTIDNLGSVFDRAQSLRILTLEDTALRPENVRDILVWMPVTVSVLHLIKNDLGPDWATEYLQDTRAGPKLSHLEGLSLIGNRMGNESEEHETPPPRRQGWVPDRETLSRLLQDTFEQWKTSISSWVFGREEAAPNPTEALPGTPPDEEEQIIAFLPRGLNLTFLDLSSCKLGDGGIKALCAADLPVLQTLILRYNLLKDPTIAALLARGWPQLKTLDLSYNLVEGKEGATSWPALLPRLEELLLQNNTIGYTGARTFMMANWPQLTTLDLRDTLLSKDGIKALRGASNIRVLLGDTRVDIETRPPPN